jgi:hypothetical protein
MRAVVHTLVPLRIEQLRAVPRGWYWLAALIVSLGLWWGIIRMVGLLLNLVFG